LNPAFPDLGGKHRTKPVPPEPHRFVAEVNAALKQQILDLPQRQRIADVHHHRQADDLGRTIEISEGILHPPRLRAAPDNLNPI